MKKKWKIDVSGFKRDIKKFLLIMKLTTLLTLLLTLTVSAGTYSQIRSWIFRLKMPRSNKYYWKLRTTAVSFSFMRVARSIRR